MLANLVLFTVLLIQPIANFLFYKEHLFAAFIGLLTNFFVMSVLIIVITSFRLDIFFLVPVFIIVHFFSCRIFFKGDIKKALLTAGIGGIASLGAAALIVITVAR